MHFICTLIFVIASTVIDHYLKASRTNIAFLDTTSYSDSAPYSQTNIAMMTSAAQDITSQEDIEGARGLFDFLIRPQKDANSKRQRPPRYPRIKPRTCPTTSGIHPNNAISRYISYRNSRHPHTCWLVRQNDLLS
jgi:hypothetical protein